jgi:hypothetical protein
VQFGDSSNPRLNSEGVELFVSFAVKKMIKKTVKKMWTYGIRFHAVCEYITQGG